MRNIRQRIWHSLLFELVLLAICVPVLSVVFDKSAAHTGALSVTLSLTAMVCNGIYNYLFDRTLIALNRPLYPRSFSLRCFHSVMFEICLMVFSLPLIMWWMDLSFAGALLLDLSFSCFVPLYALVFNWIFDLMFPAPLHPHTAT